MKVYFGSHMRIGTLVLCALSILAAGWLLAPDKLPAAATGRHAPCGC